MANLAQIPARLGFRAVTTYSLAKIYVAIPAGYFPTTGWEIEGVAGPVEVTE
jgi:hypothetical protein